MPRRVSIQTGSNRPGLDWALPAVRSWFSETFGEPTDAQRGGWPSIATGRHTVICAPTGTGKTLAAFLACLDAAWKSPSKNGVTILYVSPLKALNRDIAANLERPLAGILEVAERMGTPLRPLTAGIRTGDTTESERRRQAKSPPDILITTPESLHLLLTSRQREMFRGTTHVIIDEIHDLCGSKRGVSLTLLLERLERMCPSGFVRIGLSATMRPIEEVARFLVGWRESPSGMREPRPVEIIDAGISKQIEVTVASAAREVLGTRSEVRSLESRLIETIQSHRSTLIFANHRAEVERLTSRINRLWADRTSGGGSGAPVRSHHGSLSLDRRRDTEDQLKAGTLPAVVATASLELGIDIGTIDRVCQIGSPGSVARALQRAGRSGHSAGEVSRIDLISRGPLESLELAALAGAMRDGDVEPIRAPRNCLDVLAQQIVACVAVESWDVRLLFDLIRKANPYHDLSFEVFESVLEMLSGRSGSIDVRELRARIHWERLANRLEALPGTHRLALLGGNTIPDSGSVPVVLEGGGRVGEFAEEFVMERRVGDAVLLGTSTWVIRSIDSKKVVVAPAEGRSAVVPFWRGEGMGRSTTLGQRVGRLRRRIADGLDEPGSAGSEGWLAELGAVEPDTMKDLIAAIERQVREVGTVPSDRHVLIESFVDESGAPLVAVQTPMGRRFHLGMKLVLEAMLRERFGIGAIGHHADDGVILQFPEGEPPAFDLLDGLTPEDCESFLLRELGESPLFRSRFRQVASNALLLSRSGTQVRSPLWFQRFRADELLETIGMDSHHPLIRETVRVCLEDDLDLPGLRAFVGGLVAKQITVVTRTKGEGPSVFAAELFRELSGSPGLFVDRRANGLRRRVRRNAVTESVKGVPPVVDPRQARIEPVAVDRLEARLRGSAHPPRTIAEMAELLRFCGDIAGKELSGAMRGLMDELLLQGEAKSIALSGVVDPVRWIATESLPVYASAFMMEGAEKRSIEESAMVQIVRWHVRSHALVGTQALVERYGISRALAAKILEQLTESGAILPVSVNGAREADVWADRKNHEDLRGISLAIRRGETVAVKPEVFVDLLLRHQSRLTEFKVSGREGLESVLRLFRGFATEGRIWESELLPSRIEDFSPAMLDAFLRTEDWAWRRVEGAGEPGRLAIIPLGFGGGWPQRTDSTPLSSEARAILESFDPSCRHERDDLGARAGLDSGAVSRAIEELSSRGMIGGDHFDPIRRSGTVRIAATSRVRSTEMRGRPGRNRGRSMIEGVDMVGVRWSRLHGEDGSENDPESVSAWASALLDRFGVVCKETAAIDPWSPPWALLRASLDSAELRGEVRRGYFVAGLSGVQFAAESFQQKLARHRPEEEPAAPVLLSSVDPANLFGTGRPFPLNGLRTVSSTTHVVIFKGKPVVVSEGAGRALTIFSWASDEAVRSSVAKLVGIARPSRRILKVQTINGGPALKSEHAAALIEAGFVRNPPGLAYYAGWS